MFKLAVLLLWVVVCWKGGWVKGMGCWGGWGVLRGFFLSKTDPQIILEARIGVKGTGRSLEIAFYPIAPPPPMDQQFSIDII